MTPYKHVPLSVKRFKLSNQRVTTHGSCPPGLSPDKCSLSRTTWIHRSSLPPGDLGLRGFRRIRTQGRGQHDPTRCCLPSRQRTLLFAFNKSRVSHQAYSTRSAPNYDAWTISTTSSFSPRPSAQGRHSSTDRSISSRRISRHIFTGTRKGFAAVSSIPR